ncbi:Trp biosynthesis-associated membrane protein [Psychromicrobium xiongbiense]|uniref:Trp biosynthesis-associated membrane protein n=1 Tax=Psychromicrobium xiongbiense TaxID=3051184 RepID=UPI002554FC7A|nr:Trp biosynthesis-associated membrane protein [Psychromicrobium sp. YIM S02556]
MSETPQEQHQSRSISLPWYRRKGLLILAGILLAAALFGVTTQNWFVVQINQGVIQPTTVQVAGSKASPAVVAFAVVAVAAALAAALGGKVGRLVAAIVWALAALGAGLSALNVLLNADAAVSGPVGTQLGVTGLALDIRTQWWVWAAVVLSVLLLLGAAAVVALGRSWSQSRKFDYTAASSAPTPRGSAQSGTAAQSAEVVGSAEGGIPVRTPQAGKSAAVAEPDDIDRWDQLSAGLDPTDDHD